jgi:hypothetical protein
MISIAKELDAHDIAQEIRQERQVHKGSFLLLAGEGDIKRFAKFVDQDACSIQNCFGRDNLLGAIDILVHEGFPGVLGLADAEFDRIEGSLSLSDAVIFSEGHDFDLDLVGTDALRRYLAEVGDPHKCKEHGGHEGVRAWLLEGCKPLSMLRYMASVQDLGCSLDRIDCREICIDGGVDADLLVGQVSLGKQSAASQQDLKYLLLSNVKQGFDLMQLTCGRDFIALLGLALQDRLGDRGPEQTLLPEVKIHLRLAFSEEDFVRTSLFFAILNWESENVPYLILRKLPAAEKPRVLH